MGPAVEKGYPVSIGRRCDVQYRSRHRVRTIESQASSTKLLASTNSMTRNGSRGAETNARRDW